jgi:anti-anti-sigma factor
MSSKSALLPKEVALILADEIACIRFPQKIFQKKQAEEFRSALAELRGRKITRYVVDLSDGEYISSEGLGAIAQCWKWCHDEGNGQMAVVLPPRADSEIRNLFDIIGLSRTIGSALQPTVEDAKKYIRAFG